jgi:hypothetical protein
MRPAKARFRAAGQGAPAQKAREKLRPGGKRAVTSLQIANGKIKDLQAINQNLRSKHEMARENDKSTIMMLQKEIARLNAENGQLQANIARLAQAEAELAKAYLEINRLKSIINKDSSNSSRPSSLNGYRAIPNSREKSGRPRGGQPGHAGRRLSLPENLEALEGNGLIRRKLVDHTDGSGEYISRYVLDVEITATITEHRFAKGSPLPEKWHNEVSYGNGIKAVTALLLKEGLMAEKRLAGIFSGLTHGVLKPSPATMEKFLSEFAMGLEKNGELEAIKQDLLNGKVMNTDDTPVRSAQTIDYLENGGSCVRQAEKKSFRVTIRTHSNNTSTLFTANPKKDMDGIERDGILNCFLNILSHDHESKFYNYGNAHATCGEHLLRDLKGLHDLDMIPWADKMRRFVSGMNQHKNRDVSNGISSCNPDLLHDFELKYDLLLEQGRHELGKMNEKSFGFSSFNAMINRLTNFKDCYFLFIRDYDVPFTNNLAERDLRMEKVRENVSLLFRSWDGVVRHTQIRSFLSTLKKRNIDLFSGISRVFAGSSVLS